MVQTLKQTRSDNRIRPIKLMGRRNPSHSVLGTARIRACARA